MDAENNKVPKQDFDRWLDAALRARVEAEPSHGLERRVLARLAIAPMRRHFVWWPALVASAALLVVVFGTVMIRTSKLTPRVVTRSDRTQSSPDSYRKATVEARVVPRKTRQQRTHAGAKVTHCCGALASTGVNDSELLPKLAVFPSPRPETEQEHLLFRLAAQQSSFEMANLNPDLPTREIAVPELKIPPMDGTPPDNAPQH